MPFYKINLGVGFHVLIHWDGSF